MSTAPILEPMNLGDLLKYEAANLYSRDLATVAAGHDLALGQVVSREAASGKLVALDPQASDSTAQAVGVLAFPVDASLIDREDAVLIARHAIVAARALVWPPGITAPQKSQAIADLAALGVLVRQSA